MNIYISEVVQMANKYMKRCSTPMAIREMQMKIILRVHFTSEKIVIFEKVNKNRRNGTILHCGKN